MAVTSTRQQDPNYPKANIYPRHHGIN